MPRQDSYVTMAAGPKKFNVCSRRVGSRDRYSIIATCSEESIAEKIVDGLNALQGKIAELEAPAQRVLEETRKRNTELQRINDELRRDVTGNKHEIRRLQDELASKQQTIRSRDIELQQLHTKVNHYLGENAAKSPA